MGFPLVMALFLQGTRWQEGCEPGVGTTTSFLLERQKKELLCGLHGKELCWLLLLRVLCDRKAVG